MKTRETVLSRASLESLCLDLEGVADLTQVDQAWRDSIDGVLVGLASLPDPELVALGDLVERLWRLSVSRRRGLKPSSW